MINSILKIGGTLAYNSGKIDNAKMVIIPSRERFLGSYTKLSNGLRVATQPTYGPFCTIGVAIAAGPRNENKSSLGASHFIEKLAFTHSLNFNSEKTLALLDRSGAIVDCQTSKDTFLYAASCRTESSADILSLLADAVFRPCLLEDDVNTCRNIIKYENEMLARNPEPEPLLTDWIHSVAFRDNTVGFSKYCQPGSESSISQNNLLDFLSHYFRLERIVLAGVGVQHQWLESQALQLFDESTTRWSHHMTAMANLPEELKSSVSDSRDEPALYTGGEIFIERDLSQMALGPTPFPNLAHLCVGFSGTSITSPDFVPFCVLQSLMGGGGSFSAGGPGKGMYTRLYLDVLNKYHWIYNATAYNHSYQDCGLFCIRASSNPAQLSDLPKIIISEFERLCTGPIGVDELARAKVQLKSQLMMNLEMRPVQFEDMARQILCHGHRKHPLEYCEKIDAVQQSDIHRIAQMMLATPVSLVAYGDLRLLPDPSRIRQMIGTSYKS